MKSWVFKIIFLLEKDNKNKFLYFNYLQDFVELPPDDMQKLLVSNTVSIINIRIARWFHPKTDLKTEVRKVKLIIFYHSFL